MSGKGSDYIIIVGCGALGASIASELSLMNKSIVVIDIKESAFEKLPSEFSGFTLTSRVVGEDILEEAKIEQADVFITTTHDDNVNIMLAQIAHELYGIKKVIARVVEPSRWKVFRELGIKTISPTLLTTKKCVEIIEDKDD
ncbi:MAG: TrkA family potassium uptake protein [Kosmotogaceae bacterium]